MESFPSELKVYKRGEAILVFSTQEKEGGKNPKQNKNQASEPPL